MKPFIRSGLIRAGLAATMLFVAQATTAAEKLTVAYNQWAGFTPVFVALDKGFFKEAGVEVEMKSFPGPGDSLPALVAGHVDVSLTTPDNVIVINNSTDAKLVAVYMIDASDGADAIVSKSTLAKPADLAGKTVAVTVGEVNHLLLMKALEAGSLKESDLKVVNMSPDDAGGAFIAGNVDAAVTWEPWVSKAVQSGGKVLFSSKDAPNLLLDVVAVSPKVLAEKPAAVKALLAGLEKGVQYLKEHPDDAHAIAGKWLDVPGPDVGGMLGGVKLYTMADNKTLLDPATEASLGSSLTAISSFLHAQGRIPGEKDVKAMIDSSLVSP